MKAWKCLAVACLAVAACAGGAGGSGVDIGDVRGDRPPAIDLRYGEPSQAEDGGMDVALDSPTPEEQGGLPDPGTGDPGPTDPASPDPGLPDPPSPDPGPDPTPQDTAPPDFGPCDPTVTPWGYRDNCDGTVTDTVNGLTWMKGFGWASDLASAAKYCQEETLAGGGWRLPTIDELRSLIIGCDATDKGGPCTVVNGCITDACANAACQGCGMNQGPGKDGCYMDPVFQYYCNLYWSGSKVKAAYTGDIRSWYVTFYNARVYRPNPGEQGNWAVKCVR